MATYSELGKSAKAKYPQYQGKSDEEVGKALAIKYPEYQAKITPTNNNDKYNRGILGFINKNANKPAAFLNTLPRLGEAAVRGVAATVSQPLIPKEKRGLSGIKEEVKKPFMGGASIAEESIQQIARAEQQFPKAGKYLAPAAAIGAQLTEAFGDPENLAIGAGLMLKFGAGAKQTKGFGKIADYFFTPSKEKSVTPITQADNVATGIANNTPTGEFSETTNIIKQQFIDDLGGALKNGGVPKTGQYAGVNLLDDSGNFIPQFSAPRVSDIATKLESVTPGSGVKFAESVGSNWKPGIATADVTIGKIKPNDLINAIPSNISQTPVQFPKKPLAPTSRAKQSMFSDLQKNIENDPEFLQRINELGGGRVKTNLETINAAVEKVRDGSVTIDTIANHKAGTAVNEIDVAAGAIIRDNYEQQFARALSAGDEKAADAANDVLAKIAPGYNNLTATPGRATQIQSQFSNDKLRGIYEKVRELKAKGVSFDVMQKELNTELKNLKTSGSLEKIGNAGLRLIRGLENYATGAKLTSPVTHLVNFVSNTASFFQRGLEKTVKATMYGIRGKGGESIGTIKSAFGTSMGFKNGARRFLSTLVADAPEYGLKVENELKAVSKSPTALRLANPFRWLAAADNFWKGVIQDSEIYTKAYAAARNSGLRGKALATKITELTNVPPKAWLDEAAKVAQDYTFQGEPDKFLKAISKIRNIPGGRLLVPFIQTPYNLVKFHFQRSLPGILSTRNIQELAAGGGKAAEAISRLAVGTGLSVAALQMVQHGEVTGAYPQDKGERALWEAEGRKPYSIKIGGKWIAYNRFQPVGLYLTQAAAFNDILKSKQNPGEAFSKLIGYTSKAVLDLPFVQGFSGVIDAVQDPENYAEKALSNVITGFIPNIARDIRGFTDTKKRDAKGIEQNIQNAIPGLSTKLQPKVDIFGNVVEYEKSPLVRSVKVLSTLTPTKATKYLDDIGYAPEPANQDIAISTGNKKFIIELTPEEKTQFLVESGKATERAVLIALNNESVTKLSKEDQAYIVKNLVSAAREQVKTQYKIKYRSRLKIVK